MPGRGNARRVMEETLVREGKASGGGSCTCAWRGGRGLRGMGDIGDGLQRGGKADMAYTMWGVSEGFCRGNWVVWLYCQRLVEVLGMGVIALCRCCAGMMVNMFQEYGRGVG